MNPTAAVDLSKNLSDIILNFFQRYKLSNKAHTERRNVFKLFSDVKSPRIKKAPTNSLMLSGVIENQLILSKFKYLCNTSGIKTPSAVWLFSNNAATIRGNANAEPFNVCAK